MRKTLNEIMTHYGSDKASWAHNYCPNYEQWFESLRDQSITLLELGIGGEDKELGGASLLGWQEYFPLATIVGVDIYDKSELRNFGHLQTYQGSQDDDALMNYIIKVNGTPDIIIDDASHINQLTIKSFQILFSLLKQGGLYIVEDLQTAYRWDFNGSIVLDDMKLPTIMNYLFSMLHSLNPINPVADQSYNKPIEFVDVESVHFYPDMVVIKKK